MPKRIGDFMVQMGFVTARQVEEAFQAQQRGDYANDKRIGDILIARGNLTRAQLDLAIEEQMVDQMGGLE